MMAVVSDILMTASLAILKIDDIINIIIGFISEGATYKTARLVCRQWQGICDRDHGYCVDRFSNHLLTLLKLYPNNKWSWTKIMKNKNTTVQYATDNLWRDERTSYAYNDNIDPEIFISRKFMNARYLFKYNISDWNWVYISSCKNITWDFVISHPELPWDWDHIVYNPSVSWDIIKNNQQLFTASGVNISTNPNITIDILLEDTKINWDWIYLTMNIQPINVILDNPQLPW